MAMEVPALVKQAAVVVTSIGVIGGGAATVENRYVPAADFAKLEARILIGQFWDRLDDLRESRQQGDFQREQDIEEELIELLADICELKPHFSYCESGIPE